MNKEITFEELVNQIQNEELIEQINHVLEVKETNVELAHRQQLIDILYKAACNLLKDRFEYAKQEAIGFDYWRSENYKQVMPNGYESKIPDESANYQRRYTRHELYDLYTIFKNQKGK